MITQLWNDYSETICLVIAFVLFYRWYKRFINRGIPEGSFLPVTAEKKSGANLEQDTSGCACRSNKPSVQCCSTSSQKHSQSNCCSTRSSRSTSPELEAKSTAGPKRIVGKRNANFSKKLPMASTASKVTVFYSSLTGTCERIANEAAQKLTAVLENPPNVINLDYLDDLDDYFVTPKNSKNNVYLLIIPSYENESPLDFFIQTLEETYNDFRIDSRPLSKLDGFSVFGIGDSESWNDKFCYQALQVDRLMGKLGARRFFPCGTGCVKTTLADAFDEYLQHLILSLKNPTPVDMDPVADSDSEEEEEEASQSVADVEDIGKMITKETKITKGVKSNVTTSKQMVAKDSPTYASLTKQGYTVVGSHSGVKICRWTKSALRGRGSCYKFSFYGIKSHLCMETTPSLSCSNKCVFCWRHGTNPVGTTWRWQVDQPQDILDGALDGHYKKIKQLKGVPGVVAARFAEAFTVKHCALSLVGEPIFYPHINEFLRLLHEKHISSFLVCNAQHPTELRALKRVTQLYVSIDASNKEDLRAIDRPLNRDFWERMQECLEILREKSNQRTVFRLTLVKGFNVNDCEGYADMVEKARPSFIEVKGVTFCGASKTNPLTMKNVPFYEEVQAFVDALNKSLAKRGLDYDIAAEHAHSCCILIAQRRFQIDGVWHTHIDYKRFFELLESGVDFGPMDYISPTPSWAVYGADEGGFNPDDTRFRRNQSQNS